MKEAASKGGLPEQLKMKQSSLLGDGQMYLASFATYLLVAQSAPNWP
ncbi:MULTISPECIES: hypothetical protein [Bradyrhizobium]|nr:hypothetical protein [Bradyrhizobium embrapense]